MAKAADTPNKKVPKAKKKLPVRLQVKAVKADGTLAGREFFDILETAESFAKELKEKHPDCSVFIATYAKLGALEPSSTIEI